MGFCRTFFTFVSTKMQTKMAQNKKGYKKMHIRCIKFISQKKSIRHSRPIDVSADMSPPTQSILGRQKTHRALRRQGLVLRLQREQLENLHFVLQSITNNFRNYPLYNHFSQLFNLNCFENLKFLASHGTIGKINLLLFPSLTFPENPPNC